MIDCRCSYYYFNYTTKRLPQNPLFPAVSILFQRRIACPSVALAKAGRDWIFRIFSDLIVEEAGKESRYLTINIKS